MARILIVEDDNFLRGLLTKKLEEKGFSVVQAESGEKGVEELKEDLPDLVLLDLLLPGIDGFEVLKWARGQGGALADLPVIILSNLGRQEDIEKGTKLGATDYLVKSKSTPPEIIEKVNEAIGA